MANNRLYIRNKVTGDEKLIAKSFGFGWLRRNFDETLEDWLYKQDDPAVYACTIGPKEDGPTILEIYAEMDDTYAVPTNS